MSVFSFPNRRQGRRRHPQPFRSRPGLELLEGRALLSTVTVLNTLDSGAGSLRDQQLRHRILRDRPRHLATV
jgi:hypothetical protein